MRADGLSRLPSTQRDRTGKEGGVSFSWLKPKISTLHIMMEQSSSWSQLNKPQFRPLSWQRPMPPTLPTMQNTPKGVLDRSITSDPMTGALVASLDPAKIQEVAASQLVIIDGYYKSVLQQSQQIFRWALVAAGVGLVFFLAAVSLLVLRQPANVSLISLMCGGVVVGIAVLIFLLYGRTLGE